MLALLLRFESIPTPLSYLTYDAASCFRLCPLPRRKPRLRGTFDLFHLLSFGCECQVFVSGTDARSHGESIRRECRSWRNAEGVVDLNQAKVGEELRRNADTRKKKSGAESGS
jgi:hypothetical protein